MGWTDIEKQLDVNYELKRQDRNKLFNINIFVQNH